MKFMSAKIFVMIPTYNESSNVEKIINAIYNLKINNLHMVIVDDNSPDGTGKIVVELQKKYPSLHLLNRTSDKGRGRAAEP